MGCAAIFLYSNTIDFMNATVVTTVDTMTVPLSEVFFPSVVVCNINQVTIRVEKKILRRFWGGLQDTLLKDRQRRLVSIQPIRILFICCAYFTLIMTL